MCFPQLSPTSQAFLFRAFISRLTLNWTSQSFASASLGSSKVNNFTAQFRGLSTNQSRPCDSPVVMAVIIIINRLGWLWTSVSGIPSPPQAVRIQASSGLTRTPAPSLAPPSVPSLLPSCHPPLVVSRYVRRFSLLSRRSVRHSAGRIRVKHVSNTEARLGIREMFHSLLPGDGAKVQKEAFACRMRAVNTRGQW